MRTKKLLQPKVLFCFFFFDLCAPARDVEVYSFPFSSFSFRLLAFPFANKDDADVPPVDDLDERSSVAHVPGKRSHPHPFARRRARGDPCDKHSAVDWADTEIEVSRPRAVEGIQDGEKQKKEGSYPCFITAGVKLDREHISPRPITRGARRERGGGGLAPRQLLRLSADLLTLTAAALAPLAISTRLRIPSLLTVLRPVLCSIILISAR